MGGGEQERCQAPDQGEIKAVEIDGALGRGCIRNVLEHELSYPYVPSLWEKRSHFEKQLQPRRGALKLRLLHSTEPRGSWWACGLPRVLSKPLPLRGRWVAPPGRQKKQAPESLGCTGPPSLGITCRATPSVAVSLGNMK